MSERYNRTAGPFGVAEWMSRRWWVALSLSLLVILIARSGTVGAPTQPDLGLSHGSDQAHAAPTTNLHEQLPRFEKQVDLERQLREVSQRLAEARAALKTERTRSALLQESYDGLGRQFDEISGMVRENGARPVAASFRRSPPIPQPAEAIFVRSEKAPASAKDSN